MARTKTAQTMPLAGTVQQKVLSDSADGTVRPLGYNESYSGGGTPSAFSTVGDNLISSAPARLCQVFCQAGSGVTITVYDLATAGHAGTPIYGPVPMVAGGCVRPMLQTTTGISITVAGTSPQLYATIE